MEVKIGEDEPLYSISKAAGLLNISVPTLRMYEREGLIIPFKKESNQRLYSWSDLKRVECIRSAINEEKISIQGLKLLYSLIPCWDILNCPLSKRETCRAYELRNDPCWMLSRKGVTCSDKSCRDCEAYKDYSGHGSIQESIMNISKKKE